MDGPRLARENVACRTCVDGPRLARENVACRTEVACSHVSGLLVQSGWTAGPDGVREPSPHHSNGIDVPMKSQASLGCVGSTDCAITRHCSLASSSPSATGTRKLQPQCHRQLSGHSPGLVFLLAQHHRPGDARRLVRQRPRLRPAAAAVDAARSPTDRLWSLSIVAGPADAKVQPLKLNGVGLVIALGNMPSAR